MKQVQTSWNLRQLMANHQMFKTTELIPLLAEEVLREQFATQVDVISEATDTSVGFEKSLQVALANARRV